jgi:HrpA-like RNA helicase
MKPPHPFAVGARAYTRMMRRKKNQSVIVCGESGAGKVTPNKSFFLPNKQNKKKNFVFFIQQQQKNKTHGENFLQV